jgi:hypothetical protein
MKHQEQLEFIGRLYQKVQEMHNPNIADNSERKIALCAEFFEMCLTPAGQELLWEASPAKERFQNKLLEKLSEFAELEVAQRNAQYMAAAETLKVLLTEIKENAFHACYYVVQE